MKKTKKWIIIGIIGAVVFTLINVLLAIHMINSRREFKADIKYGDILKSKVIEYVISETDATDKYGNDLEVNVKKYTWKRYDNEALRSKIPESYEEYEAQLEEVTFYVTVNQKDGWYIMVDQRDCIVVTFTGNEEGKLEVSDWYWED